jgi:hypothetical protein
MVSQAHQARSEGVPQAQTQFLIVPAIGDFRTDLAHDLEDVGSKLGATYTNLHVNEFPLKAAGGESPAVGWSALVSDEDAVLNGLPENEHVNGFYGDLALVTGISCYSQESHTEIEKLVDWTSTFPDGASSKDYVNLLSRELDLTARILDEVPHVIPSPRYWMDTFLRSGEAETLLFDLLETKRALRTFPLHFRLGGTAPDLPEATEATEAPEAAAGSSLPLLSPPSPPEYLTQEPTPRV